jgi:hypothetical protein
MMDELWVLTSKHVDFINFGLRLPDQIWHDQRKIQPAKTGAVNWQQNWSNHIYAFSSGIYGDFTTVNSRFTGT